MIYSPGGSGDPGDATLRMDVRVDRCNNSSCSSRTFIGEPTLNFDVATNSLGQPAEFASWDNGGGSLTRTHTRQNPSISYFSQGAASDSNASNLCSGWDPNDDTSDDRGDTSPRYNLRWATDTGDTRGSLFHYGDVIPLDWQTDHNLDIRRRLA